VTVGKGLFDSGGLDLKGAANMRLEEDMGGAAHVWA
jgi:leucyl aminopeptidase